MKDILKKIFGAVLTVILIPVAVIVILIMVICTPADYIKYKRSRYCKDTKAPYEWYFGSSYLVTLYDTVKKNSLPIDFHRNENGEDFFVSGDTLILYGLGPVYDAEAGKWFEGSEDKAEDVSDIARESICECNALLGSEVCKSCAVLVYDAEILENTDEAVTEFDCFRIVFVEEDDLASALKTIIS